MTKEYAIKLLEQWIEDHAFNDGNYKSISLPLLDSFVYREHDEDGIHDWTFKGLIKVAYDL